MRFILKFVFLTLLMSGTVSCKSEHKVSKTKEEEKQVVTELSIAEKIVNNTIEAHGGELYDEASYRFSFRNKEYTFINKENEFKYTLKKVSNKKDTVLDILENGVFTRRVNGKQVSLSEEDASKYGESLNSVVYFATLPHKLNDSAVKKLYKGEIEIKGENYDVIEVTFKQEGGGKDFEDKYYYWINKKSHKMDYLAYTYKVNGGGVRFRSSYNRINVGGIIFQDYINYKAEVGTYLKDLPVLYENDKLKEVSRINIENINLIE
ncbi:hypothetical protein BTO06_17195 [Tenacibaculum sp. SZ-18]|uniref:DUF6503 family protein n=1 Tax=Tenacibaculum sp. SZ-18 TaxID=754423 RepID=UPI000C2D3907|nr:DUF6503 family protein [Tenacibaculum sp. SZ-18]AUC16773.1 hypothetical protein BTO06_17195 [Tenacibaculum sp. SZ-18]